MTRPKCDRLPLPTADQVFWSPERAILALLDTHLLLAITALDAQHPALTDLEAFEQPSILNLANAIIASAGSLRQLIAGYDKVAQSLVEMERCHAPRVASDDNEIPF
jgi:hypothetical protein